MELKAWARLKLPLGLISRSLSALSQQIRLPIFTYTCTFMTICFCDKNLSRIYKYCFYIDCVRMQSRPHATDEQRRLLDSLRWDLRFQLCGDYEYSTMIIRKPVSIYAQLMSQATLWEFQVLIDYQNKRTYPRCVSAGELPYPKEK